MRNPTLFFNLSTMDIPMSETAEDTLLREEALNWFHHKEPHKKLDEDKIVEMYKNIKEYAKGDPLLEEYYRANHVKV